MFNFFLSRFGMIGAAVTGVAAVGVIAWQATQLPAPVAIQRPAVAPPTGIALPTPAAPVQAPSTGAPADPAKPQISLPLAPPGAPAPVVMPAFDVVRVEPTGEAVVAGRSAPQAMVTLLNGERKIGESKADANGQFVIIPKPLAVGDHLLSLRASGAGGEILSVQTVTVAVAGKTGEKTVVALTEPDKPTVLFGEPVRPQGVASPATTLAIRTVEAGEEGAFFASGIAPPGASIRLYLNSSLVANVQAAVDGKWALKVERGMAAGQYDVRADMVEAATGKVLARAQVPFDYPVPQVAARSSRPEPGSPAITSTPGVQTAIAPLRAGPEGLATAAPSTPTVPAQPVQSPATPPRPTAGAPTASALVVTPPVQVAAAPVRPVTRPAVAQPDVAQSGVARSGLAIVPEIRAVTVSRGDNLWRISRKVLGRGARYTQIYEANASQIRDPNRIWPGQVFVAPQL